MLQVSRCEFIGDDEAKTSPGTVALRHLQRTAIMNDPEFHDGRYEQGKGPKKVPKNSQNNSQGLALARELATLTYRSTEEFDKRFKWSAEEPYKVFQIDS